MGLTTSPSGVRTLPGGSSGQFQYNNAGAFAGGTGITIVTGAISALTIAGENDALALNVVGGTITSALGGILMSFTGVWNTVASPIAFRLNITDTASGAASLLMDLQVGASSMFSIGKTGNITSTRFKTDSFGNLVLAGDGLFFQGTGFGSDDLRMLFDGTNLNFTVGAVLRLSLGSTIAVASGTALQLGNAATTGLLAGALAALTNASVTLKDSTGQLYRIPCII